MLRGSVLAGFLSAYILGFANWEAVGRAVAWNERSRSGTGPSGEEPACVFYRHKDDPSVSDMPTKTAPQNTSAVD